VQTFVANADGSEVDRFYGCWLDINQPFKPNSLTPNNVLPAQLDVAHPDGPYTDSSNPPLPIQQAILRALHQCLIAEIAFDPVAIPLGKDPSNWDKLAQRNLAWSDVNPAQAVTTFEVRPTPLGLPAGRTPDELMIDWNNLPRGTASQIYLPAVSADIVLAMANRMYTSHRLSRVDAHTLQCTTGGISYVPIPPGININYAGLLTVDLSHGAPRGEVFNVVVRQLTNAFGRAVPPPPPPPQIAAHRGAAVAPAELQWRQVLGAFQLTIPVRAKELLLVREERELSVLRWIAEAIPHHNRWYPAFQRYLQQIAGRVTAFGGDPTQILPSPTGEGRKRPPVPPGELRLAHTGKVAGLCSTTLATSRASCSRPKSANILSTAGKRRWPNWPSAPGASDCASPSGPSATNPTAPSPSSSAIPLCHSSTHIHAGDHSSPSWGQLLMPSRERITRVQNRRAEAF
jgi:hypothetical protein